ncbi:bacteriochlorophyll 4-vinyl reductase [Erythrobacter sp. SCSIO 43205]|uniref:bacteriochlorophyll 4-vinyl reductase n=1 Tax=Erythrobacter sp. SCSIO 43205 TaxID=2779361 RepID=UPI001CA8E65F|nr:bacteriochlorophyll 4-vinyl reductase [Erythrobacter sp. SCSIO 43205]UAB77598.1 bacteriochlorophyll 4-vinyl reductase [Erythrobacter sp. SCSIO 43205]
MLIEAPILAAQEVTQGKVATEPGVPIPIKPAPIKHAPTDPVPSLSLPPLSSNEDEALAQIGPHALIHAVEVMRELLDQDAVAAVFSNAQIDAVPTGDAMVSEVDALRLHRWLAAREPFACFEIAGEAAKRTGDYIIAHRIPKLAARVLKILPARLAAPLLMRAISRHAWTFVGAGRFTFTGGWRFRIDRRAAGDATLPAQSLFHWYAGVFERLYQRLIAPDCHCEVRGCDEAELEMCDYLITRSR